MFLRLFHLSVASLFWYTVWYDLSFMNIPFPAEGMAEYPLRGRTIFLTYWCFFMQTTYFTISVLNDFMGTNVAHPKQTSILRTVKDTLFILAFPTAVNVACTFWGIYAVDKQLVFPDHLAKEFPPWVNQIMHTSILLFITLELVSSYRQYPSRFIGFSIVILFYLTYVFWLHCIYYKTGAWVYPIFNVLNLPSRIVFIALSTSLVLVFYVLGERVNTLVWSKVSKEKVKSK